MSESMVAGSKVSANRKFSLPMVTLSDRHQLLDVLPKLMNRLAPQWPLQDFVAVNPLHGYNDMNLLQAMQELQRVRDAELLMPLTHYRERMQSGALTEKDINFAYKLAQRDFEVLFETFRIRPEEIASQLQQDTNSVRTAPREYRTVAEQIPYSHEIHWGDVVVEEISRFCASVFSESEVAWGNPWRHRGLYASWQAAKQLDRRMEWLGIPNFRKMIRELPESPVDCIATILQWLGIPQPHWKGFLLAQWYSLVGWVSYIQGKNFGATPDDLDENDLIGLLAIRLAYDACLAQHHASRSELKLVPEESSPALEGIVTRQRLLEDLARYCGLIASESHFRNRLLFALRDTTDRKGAKAIRSKFQLIFCIDVRSEVIRRHVEDVSGDAETLGFAGFFGLPFQLRSMGEQEGTNAGKANQCPVLLTPKFTVDEVCLSSQGGCDCREALPKNRRVWDWTGIQRLASSAVACFGYVEALGVTYAPKHIGRMLPVFRRGPKGAAANQAGPANRARLIRKDNKLVTGLTLSQRITFAKSILVNLGVKDRLGSIVIFVGHGSKSTNNPFQASLDCGACGGHSGESNARLAAQLLNDQEVRQGLRDAGVSIPATCWFMAGVHNTTTDEITLVDDGEMPQWARADVDRLREQLPVASQRAQEERNLRFGCKASDNAYRRAVDWSEIRPEWGLVNNAAFIAAPRELTQGLSLEGRVFLHSYHPNTDPDGSILELILTAPVVVAHWINTQYYFSTVDPLAFGSGNKVLHSVVGGIGVVEGNGGDLKIGLPWQSVHDGKRFQHEPLRLSVLLYATAEAIDRVIAQHGIVQNLVNNGWIHITSWQEGGFFERLPGQGWNPIQEIES